MVDQLRVEVPGWPIAWQRPKGHGGGWAPERNTAHLKALADHLWAVLQGVKGRWNTAAPVGLDTEFHFERAPSKRNPHGEGRTIVVVRSLPLGPWRAKVPDLDNLAKLVQEAVGHSGVVDDDKQVVALSAKKVQGAG